MSTHSLTKSTGIDPSEPLWKRLPTHDDTGKPLSDFMMIIPNLHKKPQHIKQSIISDIQRILGLYGDKVVFAEVNLKLNLLWVSMKAVHGLYLEIPAAIQTHVPEAMLVGHQ